MNQDKLHLINELFGNKTIRTIWDKNAEQIKQWLAHLGNKRINETFDP